MKRLILFDGTCGLCNRWVDLILRLDRRGLYRFAALQSGVGQACLARHRLPRDYDASIVLIQGERSHIRSAAVIEILAGLGRAWRVLRVIYLVPAFLRDWLYDVVATHRYAWYGRTDTCRIVTAAERSRFL